MIRIKMRNIIKEPIGDRVKHSTLANKTSMAILLSLAMAPQASALTLEDLAKRLDALESQNQMLLQENADLRQAVAQTNEKAEAAVFATEAIADSASGLTKLANWADKTTISGYGELHYNNLDNKPGSNTNEPFREADFHRFVLFFGHEFNDNIRFYSEFELEHSIAGDDQNGEIELEQAYLEFGLTDQTQARAGVFLVPIGILNETHEPNTFYGVERNDVENIIIPSTWWEAGAALNHRLENGLSFDLAVHTGLEVPTTGGSAFRVRSGRNKASQAAADDLAATARVKYTGIPGLELAATAQYQSDISQAQGDGLEDAMLYETHAVYQRGPFALRALYAMWDINGAGAKTATDTNGGITSTGGGDEQKGWYLEPSYSFNTRIGKVGAYVRYEDVDGFRVEDEFSQWETGLNYWPHGNVVIKVDYRSADNDNDSSFDYQGFDLGVGYQF